MQTFVGWPHVLLVMFAGWLATASAFQIFTHDNRFAARVVATTSEEMKGRVCIVTGASRGIGKAVALELGKVGATVYVTGTSSSAKSSTSSRFSTNADVGGPGTIEETAELVSAAGGKGIAVACNHADDQEVAQLFARVADEQGRLDVLVNNAFRVPTGGHDAVVGKFWELDVEVWDAMHTVGLRSHYVASSRAVPIMLRNPPTANPSPPPLIAMISSFGGITYTFNVAYGAGKAAVDRLAKDMAVELKPHQICTCSLYPGVVMTERMKKLVQSGEAARLGIPLDDVETPAYAGRAVVALATDANNMRKTGSVQVVAELATGHRVCSTAESNTIPHSLGAVCTYGAVLLAELDVPLLHVRTLLLEEIEYGFSDDAECVSEGASPSKLAHRPDKHQPSSIRSLRFLVRNYGMSAQLRRLVPRGLIPDWRLPFWIMALGKPE